jgi:hypothetical protein
VAAGRRRAQLVEIGAVGRLRAAGTGHVPEFPRSTAG